MTRTIAVLVAAAAACSVSASEPPAPAGSTDSQLLEKLLGDEPARAATDAPAAAESPAKPSEPPAATPTIDPATLETIAKCLRDAQQRLAAKQTGDSTQAAQRKVINELDRLIHAARNEASKAKRQQSSRPHDQPADSEPRPDQSPGEQAASPMSAGGQAASQPRRNRDGKAEESSDRPQETHPSADRIGEYRAGVARETWGHLPQRLREQLLNAGSDRVLPQYDATIRRYFESLAKPESPAH